MATTLLFDWVIRATLLLVVAIMLARVFELRSAATAHRLLAVMFFCILVSLPICMLFAPHWQLELPVKTTVRIDKPSPTAPIAVAADETTTRIAVSTKEQRTNEASHNHSPVKPHQSVDANSLTAGTTAPYLEITESSDALLLSQGPLSEEQANVGTINSVPWLRIISLCWLAIAGILALRVLLSVLSLARFVSTCTEASKDLSEQVGDLSRQCGLSRHVRVLLSEVDAMPMACWLGRWSIVLPENIESWPEELKEVTVLHELGHIARRDAWADYLAQSISCFLWPNPIAWFAAVDSRRLRERACDEWSLQRYNGDAKQYGLGLLEVVRRCQQPSSNVACAMADKRGLESRLQWLFSDSASPKTQSFLSVFATLVCLGVSIAVATANPTDGLGREDSQDSDSKLRQVVKSKEPSSDASAISVSGIVVDKSGNPIEGASVVLRANLGGVQYARGMQHARDMLAQTKTNAQGKFEFSNVGIPPRLVGISDQLRHGKPGVQVLAWSEGTGLQWMPVDKLTGTTVKFKLDSEADVFGDILDEDGNSVEAGVLTVVGFTKATDNMDGFLQDPGDLNTIRSELQFSGLVQNGRFTLENMPKDYRISVRCEGHTGHRSFFVIDTGSGTFSEIKYRNAGRESIVVHRTPIRAIAKQQPWVQVKVIDHEGNPVRGGGLEAVDAERHYGGSTAVGEDGMALLIVNKPGIHDLYYAGDPLAPRLGSVHEIEVLAEASDVVEMRLPASTTLNGQVVDSDTGRPVAGVYVYGGSTAIGKEKPHATGSVAVSNTDGRFELPVAEGVCKLSISHEVDGYFVPTYAARQDVGPEPKSMTVTVAADSQPENVVVKIARGLAVDGTVIDQNGEPASGLRVTASSEGAPYRNTATTTDAAGRFSFSGLSPYVPVRIGTWTDRGVAEHIIAAADDHPWEQTRTEAIELKINAGTSVVGRVTKGGRPEPGVRVGLRRAGPSQQGEDWVRFSLLCETTTDEQGAYRLTGLKKGDKYQLEVEPQEGAEVRDWRYQSPYSHTVNVEDGQTIEVPDAELKSNGQKLVGVVVDTEGNPVEGITVSAKLASGMHLSRPQNGSPPWTKTDARGRFKLTHLPDEPISLMAYKANPAGGRILHPSHASPEMNADDIRIVFDPSLVEEPESLD